MLPSQHQLHSVQPWASLPQILQWTHRALRIASGTTIRLDSGSDRACSKVSGLPHVLAWKSLPKISVDVSSVQLWFHATLHVYWGSLRITLSIWKCRRTLLAVLWAVRFWDMEVTIDAGQHPFLEENASLTLIVCYYDCVALDLMEIGAIAGEICTFPFSSYSTFYHLSVQIERCKDPICT